MVGGEGWVRARALRARRGLLKATAAPGSRRPGRAQRGRRPVGALDEEPGLEANPERARQPNHPRGPGEGMALWRQLDEGNLV